MWTQVEILCWLATMGLIFKSKQVFVAMSPPSFSSTEQNLHLNCRILSAFSPDSSLEDAKLTRMCMLTSPQPYTQSLKAAESSNEVFWDFFWGGCFYKNTSSIAFLISHNGHYETVQLPVFCAMCICFHIHIPSRE